VFGLPLMPARARSVSALVTSLRSACVMVRASLMTTAFEASGRVRACIRFPSADGAGFASTSLAPMIVGRPFAAAGDGFVEMGAGLGSGVAGFAGGVQLALADVLGRGAGIAAGGAAA